MKLKKLVLISSFIAAPVITGWLGFSWGMLIMHRQDVAIQSAGTRIYLKKATAQPVEIDTIRSFLFTDLEGANLQLSQFKSNFFNPLMLLGTLPWLRYQAKQVELNTDAQAEARTSPAIRSIIEYGKTKSFLQDDWSTTTVITIDDNNYYIKLVSEKAPGLVHEANMNAIRTRMDNLWPKAQRIINKMTKDAGVPDLELKDCELEMRIPATLINSDASWDIGLSAKNKKTNELEAPIWHVEFKGWEIDEHACQPYY